MTLDLMGLEIELVNTINLLLTLNLVYVIIYPMNRLTTEKRVQILGMSAIKRSVSRTRFPFRQSDPSRDQNNSRGH